jgi:hypothetical protein
MKHRALIKAAATPINAQQIKIVQYFEGVDPGPGMAKLY